MNHHKQTKTNQNKIPKPRRLLWLKRETKKIEK